MRLGRRQLELLTLCANPTGLLLLAPDRLSASLVRRGMLRQLKSPGACCITPAGLRGLADALEAGQVRDGLQLAEDRRLAST